MNTRLRNTLNIFALTLALSPIASYAQNDKNVPPKVDWEAESTAEGNGFGAILLDGAQIVAGDDQGALRAFDRNTGEILWTHDHGSRIYGAPTSDGEWIFFVSKKGLSAVNRKDGEFVWKYHIQNGADFCTLAKKQNCIIVGGYDGAIHAVSRESGEEFWTVDVVKDAPADPPGFDGARARLDNFPARPAGITCDDAFAYVCIFDQCRVIAIDLKSGKKTWSFQTEGWVSSAPAISEDSLIVGSQDKHIWCLDKATGQLKWKFKTEGRADDRCVIEKEIAYFGAGDGRLYCLNIKDGKETWRFETDKDVTGRRTDISSKPYLTKDRVLFAASDAKLYSLEKETGKLSWKFEVLEKSEAYCDTISDDQRVYLVTRKTVDKTGKNAIVAVTPAE